MGFQPPNHTQTPNELFDHWLPHLTEAELKVLLVIFRKTFGWHKNRDKISITQLMTLTGLAKHSVINAGRTLHQKGLILRETLGPNGRQETYFELVIEENSNNSDQCKISTPPSANNAPPPVQNSNPQNINKTKSKDVYVKDNVSRTPKNSKPNDKTLLFNKKDKDNVSFPKKFKLTDDQVEIFNYLKTLSINSNDETLCWWAKNYTLARILEVYNASEGKNSIGAYMNRLLKVRANVAQVHAKMNREFAEDFKSRVRWHSLNIGKVYCTFPIGSDVQEISLNMEPLNFAEYLLQKHETFQAMNRGNNEIDS
jgi:phage replication O-like protein O